MAAGKLLVTLNFWLQALRADHELLRGYYQGSVFCAGLELRVRTRRRCIVSASTTHPSLDYCRLNRRQTFRVVFGLFSVASELLRKKIDTAIELLPTTKHVHVKLL